MTGKKVIPDVDQLAILSRELRPTKVHYKWTMKVFGMSMSDGQRVIGGDESLPLKTAELPEKLTRIEVIFRKDEWHLHSMRFIGETVLHIGYTDQEHWSDNWKAGRVETVTLEPGEELIGCEIHYV